MFVVGAWPESFGLQQLAEGLVTRAELERLLRESNRGAAGGAAAEEVAVATDARYPLRRRVGRLSYAIWDLIGREKGTPLQRVLEATSTAERLRFAVLRMRSMTGRTFTLPE